MPWTILIKYQHSKCLCKISIVPNAKQFQHKKWSLYNRYVNGNFKRSDHHTKIFHVIPVLFTRIGTLTWNGRSIRTVVHVEGQIFFVSSIFVRNHIFCMLIIIAIACRMSWIFCLRSSVVWLVTISGPIHTLELYTQWLYTQFTSVDWSLIALCIQRGQDLMNFLPPTVNDTNLLRLVVFWLLQV